MADEMIRGGRELAEFLKQLPVKMEKNIMRAALGAGARVIRDEARQLAPIDQGDLRKSIKVSTNSKGGTVKAKVKAGGGAVYYAHMVEYGTKPHLIKVKEEERPINYRLTLKRGVLTRVSMRTINRNSLVIGNTFVGPTLSHPGAKPTPFMRPAMDNKSSSAVTAIATKVRERLTKEGINAPEPEVE